MSEVMKATPGPWKLSGFGDEGWYLKGADGELIETIYRITGREEVCAANAHRIVNCVNHFDVLRASHNALLALILENKRRIGYEYDSPYDKEVREAIKVRAAINNSLSA